MSNAEPGPIRTFFRFIWNLVNFTNHLVFNIIMLLIIFLIIGTIAVGMSAKSFEPLNNNTALVLDLRGQLVEQRTVDSLSAALASSQGDDDNAEIQLRDILAVLEKAKTDPKISHVLLNTEGFQVKGMASLRELVKALQDFKTSKKPIYAFASGYEQKQYLLAAQADKVFMDPEGGMLFEGLGRYRLYYREALQDKLGIDVHLFRVGEYKSAAEPYILDAASEEAKEADLYWMNDIWDRYLDQVAKARKLDKAEIVKAINEMPERIVNAKGDLALWALNEKWIDGVKTSQEMEQFMLANGVAKDEENYTFQQISFTEYLGHVKNQNLAKVNNNKQIAIVVAQGEITAGDQPAGIVGGESTATLIREARENEDIKALVLRVDSPGGEVYPSEQIRREVELTKAAGKPVVVSMANVAASGGYWISMNADKIYADESTITGSIGIYGLMIRTPKTLAKIGIHADGVSTTPWASAFDLSQPMTQSASTVIQAVIDRGYFQFVSKVSKAREQTYEQINENARGRVWSGAQAKEKGLVDAMGGLGDAVQDAAKRAKLKEGQYSVEYIEIPLTPFEEFITNLSGNSATQGFVRNLSPAIHLLQQTKSGQQISKDLFWLNSSAQKPINAVAHCLCVF
ncbi:MAG TPA: signal peptide peptidase SppA [Arenimonas sp.]|nr:signal peptide peptidase SppA [Arenimonas sp.]